MSRAALVEIDFLGLERRCGTARFRPPASSLRGIQNAVSKLDPHLLRTVIASGAAAATAEMLIPSPPTRPVSTHVPPPPRPPLQTDWPPKPTITPASRPAVEFPPGTGAPMTIFYKGTVAVFELPHHKAEAIIRWAKATHVEDRREEGSDGAFAGNGVGHEQQQLQGPPSLLDKLGDIPIARRKSLERFLKKRKESSWTMVFPCSGSTTSSSSEWAGDSRLSGEVGKEKMQKRKRHSIE